MHGISSLSSSESPSRALPALRSSPSSGSINSTFCCAFPCMSSGRYSRTRSKESSSGSAANSPEHNANSSETEEPACNNVPPIVVETMRWTAIPQTFTVRKEATFTVTCTVVQPVAKKGLAIFKRSKSPALNESEVERIGAGKPVVDLRSFDDAVRVVDKPSDEQWGNVFGGGETQLQQEPVTRQTFLVDHANDRLMIPEVDVGIAFHMREDYESAEKEDGSQEPSEPSSFASPSSVYLLQCDSSTEQR